ncbi:Clathrin light chain [Thecaphora frezii]
MSFDFGSPKEVDPTADFLAREREAAGVLSGDADLFGAGGAASTAAPVHDDFERSASAFPALDDDGIPAPSAGAGSGGFGFDDEPVQAASVPSVGGANGEQDERQQFESSFPEIPEEPTDNFGGGATNGYLATPAAAPMPTSSQHNATYTSANYDDDDEEPEAVRLWREKQKDDIARRDAEAERKKAEAISKAERDIDNFYAEYNTKKKKNIAKNKEAEAKFHEERTRELAEGTTWTRVCKILDLQNSQSKTIARTTPGATDLSRMKGIYLSLRKEGETAPGASGY